MAAGTRPSHILAWTTGRRRSISKYPLTMHDLTDPYIQHSFHQSKPLYVNTSGSRKLGTGIF